MFKGYFKKREHAKKSAERMYKELSNQSVEHFYNIENDDEKKISTITLDLTEGDVYKPYSNQTMLSDDIFDFLEESFKLAKKTYDIHLVLIVAEEMDENEIEKIKKLIYFHYAVKHTEIKKELRRTKFVGLTLLITGMVTYCIYGLLQWFKINFIFQEVIEIFAWVFIWESCDQFFFVTFGKRIEATRSLLLFNSDIKIKRKQLVEERNENI